MKNVVAFSLGCLGLILLTCVAYAPSFTKGVALAWNPNPEPDIMDYRVHMGTNSRSYQWSWATSSPITGMVIMAQGQVATNTNYFHFSQQVFPGSNFPPYSYFAATARNTSGLESDYSNEVILTNKTELRPATPGTLRIGQ